MSGPRQPWAFLGHDARRPPSPVFSPVFSLVLCPARGSPGVSLQKASNLAALAPVLTRYHLVLIYILVTSAKTLLPYKVTHRHLELELQ